MRPGKRHRILLSAALLQLCAFVSASPLSTAPEATGLSAVPSWILMSAEQLARTDPELEMSSRAIAFGSARAGSSTFGLTGILDEVPDLGASDRGLREQLRGIVNTQPGSRGPGSGRQGHGAPPSPWLAGIDAGAAIDEWVRETMQSLVHSTLRLDTNERGRASFSVLGMGDFSVTMSGDRSQLALSEGDDVLFVAQRSHPYAAGSTGNRAAQSEAAFPFAGDSPHASLDPPALRQAIDLAVDVASHPLSLLFYCIAAAFLLLWSVLSHTKQKKRTRPRVVSPAAAATVAVPAPAPRRKRRHRLRTHLPAADITRVSPENHARVAPPEVPPVTAATPVKRRKRIRVKVRMRMRKPASSGRT